MRALVAWGWGALFGVGLTLSGMTQPAKVLGFLDVTGAWDPTLLFVMGGALGVFALLRPWVVRSRASAYPAIAVRPMAQVDGQLLVGAAVFGAGWGLGGFCPGPAIVAAGSGSSAAILVVVTLAIGIRLAELWLARSVATPEGSSGAPDACA